MNEPEIKHQTSIHDHENKCQPAKPIWTSEDYIALVSRFFVWGLLFSVLFILRSFFLLIFLTFIFAYIQARAVERLAPRIKRRTTRCISVGLVFLFVIIGIGYFLVPQLRYQAVTFATNFSEYLQRLDTELVRLGKGLPRARRVCTRTS